MIESFKGYRDLLVPIQKNLNDFMGTYDAMSENIAKLNASFGSDLKGKIDDIFKQMSSQASKMADFAQNIDKLTTNANRYASEVGNLMGLFSKIEDRLSKINDLEKKAESQIARLDDILEEKSKSYNLKELQTALGQYNTDVKKIGEFINKDIADTLMGSKESLDTIKNGLEDVVKVYSGDNTTMEKLLENSVASEALLRKIVEEKDVNEAYIYDILDKWAEDRKVKTKK